MDTSLPYSKCADLTDPSKLRGVIVNCAFVDSLKGDGECANFCSSE